MSTGDFFGQTPVRELGAGHTTTQARSFHGPRGLRSDELRRVMDRQEAAESAQVVDNGGAPLPWWEGATAVALESMRQSRFSFGIALQAGWEYDDNLFLTDGDETGGNSIYFSAPLTLAYEGGLITFDAAYTPEFRMYDVAGIDDEFNHAFGAGVLYERARSSLGADVRFVQDNGAVAEVGRRTESTLLFLNLTASYEISPKTTLGAFASWDHQDYDGFNSFDSYAASVFADYKFTEKTAFGLQAGYDVDDISTGLDAQAVNTSLRAAWQATQKMAFKGSAGYEWREYDGGATLRSPVYSLGFLLHPQKNLSVSVDAYRRNTPSVSLENQSYYSDGVVLTVGQKIADRFQVNLSGGFEHSEFESSLEDVAASREDSFWYIRPSVTYGFAQRFALSVYYQYSNNDSSGEDQASFARNLMGATLSVSY